VASRFGGRAPEGWPPADPRKQLFQHGGLLSQARLVMISRMAKPEEVLVVEDENGEIVRETFKDTEAIVRSRRPVVWRCLHAIDARRLQERIFHF
jgi:hypothetical protein